MRIPFFVVVLFSGLSLILQGDTPRIDRRKEGQEMLKHVELQDEVRMLRGLVSALSVSLPSTKSWTFEEYQVGWICALHLMKNLANVEDEHITRQAKFLMAGQ